MTTFDNVSIASSPNSTGDFVVQACLKQFGFDVSQGIGGKTQ